MESFIKTNYWDVLYESSWLQAKMTLIAYVNNKSFIEHTQPCSLDSFVISRRKSVTTVPITPGDLRGIVGIAWSIIMKFLATILYDKTILGLTSYHKTCEVS